MPNSWLSSVMKEGIYTQTIGRRILHLEHVSSTMDEASALAAQGAEDGTVVVAEEQWAARGRFSRPWVSPEGNLSLSIILRPQETAAGYISMLAGVAAVRAVGKTTSLEARLKWPNDVLVGGKKLCGILVEPSYLGDLLQYAVVGIGINVALDPSEVPDISRTATSLALETGEQVQRGPLLRNLLEEMDALYLELERTTPQAADSAPEAPRILGEYRSCLDTLGRHVEVVWQDDTCRGVAEDVNDLGNLVLKLDNGETRVLSAGEVTLARPEASEVI